MQLQSPVDVIIQNTVNPWYNDLPLNRNIQVSKDTTDTQSIFSWSIILNSTWIKQVTWCPFKPSIVKLSCVQDLWMWFPTWWVVMEWTSWTVNPLSWAVGSFWDCRHRWSWSTNKSWLVWYRASNWYRLGTGQAIWYDFWMNSYGDETYGSWFTINDDWFQISIDVMWSATLYVFFLCLK